MDKQAQDRLWNELSEESKKFVKSLYYYVKDPNRELYDYEDRAQKELLESICGEHNLNPKQIKTWEDVEKLNDFYVDDINDLHKCDWQNNDKLVNKLIATYKIFKLIDLGYGGVVSEEEMKDTSIDIYNIYPDEKKQLMIGCLNTRIYDFICFHNRQQAEEFMSYESNRQLVKQYYLM